MLYSFDCFFVVVFVFEMQLIFVFVVETGFHHVGQAGLEAQVICPPWPPKELGGLQCRATTPDLLLVFNSGKIYMQYLFFQSFVSVQFSGIKCILTVV